MNRESPDTSLLVLGLGNPIRHDDAVGLHVLREVQTADAVGRPEDVAIELRELCAGGFDLMYEVLGFDALIVVDAFFDQNASPGRVRVLSTKDLAANSGPGSLPHLLSLPQALEWCDVAGLQPPRLHSIVTIDVGPNCMEFGEGLSPEVQEAIPLASQKLKETIKTCVDELRQPADHGRASNGSR